MGQIMRDHCSILLQWDMLLVHRTRVPVDQLLGASQWSYQTTEAKADKKAGNVAVEGCVASYVHFNNKTLGMSSWWEWKTPCW